MNYVKFTGKKNTFFFFFLVFLFRLGFGLCSVPLYYEDERDLFIIGLKSYTTHTWSYFGPTTEDLDETNFIGNLPGALGGLIISSALHLWPDPVSPYLLVNTLIFLSLTLFAWYCSKRFPEMPSWFIFSWVYIAPWSLIISTKVECLSMGTVGGILFFLGFMESISPLKIGVISQPVANFLMGFSTFWIMNFHQSWILFGFLAFLSVILQYKYGTQKKNLLFFFLGAILTFLFVLPTYFKYGFASGDLSELLLPFNLPNFLSYFSILERFISFSCFVVPLFYEVPSADAFLFLNGKPWLLIPTIIFLAFSWVQIIFLVLIGVLKNKNKLDPKNVIWITFGITLTIWVSFWFTVRHPLGHRYFLLFPFSLFYLFYCLKFCARAKNWNTYLKIFIFFVIVLLTSKGIHDGLRKKSFYLRDRDRISKAILLNDYHVFGEKRPYFLEK